MEELIFLTVFAKFCGGCNFFKMKELDELKLKLKLHFSSLEILEIECENFGSAPKHINPFFAPYTVSFPGFFIFGKDNFLNNNEIKGLHYSSNRIPDNNILFEWLTSNIDKYNTYKVNKKYRELDTEDETRLLIENILNDNIIFEFSPILSYDKVEEFSSTLSYDKVKQLKDIGKIETVEKKKCKKNYLINGSKFSTSTRKIKFN